MPHINDLKYTALLGLTGQSSGQMNDLEKAWLMSALSVSEPQNLNDLWYNYLITQGATPGHVNSMMYEWLGTLGYTGHLQDRLYQLWAAGGPSSFDGVFQATFDSGADLDVYGSASPTGTLVGATVTGGYLNLNGNPNYVYWNPSPEFTFSGRIITVNLLIEPQFSGLPAANQRLFYIGTNTFGFAVRNLAWELRSSGGLNLWIHDGSGIVVNYNAGDPGFVSGTTYEMELNCDMVSGATRMFIDGTQFGVTQTGTSASWLTPPDYMSIGDVNSGVNLNQNFRCHNMNVWDVIQHTSDY